MTLNRLTACVGLLVFATLAMNLLSAVIRHEEAGVGCAPWPACYAHIGPALSPQSAVAATSHALTPTQTIKRAHRAIATTLVLLVLLVTYLARTRGLPPPARFVPQLLIAVVLLLAVIGPASYRKTLPAIAALNLIGGMTVLALGYWLWLVLRNTTPLRVAPQLARWAFAIVVLQLVLGGWMSANFAGAACSGLWQCGEAGFTGKPLQALWFWRELAVDETGRVIMDVSQQFIQVAHRCGALVTAFAVGALGIALHRSGGLAARWGHVLAALLIAQLCLGTVAVVQGLSMPVVLAHNLTASALLLAMVRVLLGATREQQ